MEATRRLTPGDLGVPAASLTRLGGAVTSRGRDVLASIRMIEGDIPNPFGVLKSLTAMARARGATSLTLEAAEANARLLEVLVRRYGATTAGSMERVVVAIEG